MLQWKSLNAIVYLSVYPFFFRSFKLWTRFMLVKIIFMTEFKSKLELVSA